jgi:hypothetical protein
MPITTRKKKGNPDDILECHQSFVKEGSGGTFISYAKGDRVRREDIAAEVKNYADFFKLDGDRDPIPVPAPAPVYDDPHAAKILQPLPDEEVAVCRDGLVTIHEGRWVAIVAGERVPKSHSIVRAFPDRLELN